MNKMSTTKDEWVNTCSSKFYFQLQYNGILMSILSTNFIQIQMKRMFVISTYIIFKQGKFTRTKLLLLEFGMTKLKDLI